MSRTHVVAERRLERRVAPRVGEGHEAANRQPEAGCHDEEAIEEEGEALIAVPIREEVDVLGAVLFAHEDELEYKDDCAEAREDPTPTYQASALSQTARSRGTQVQMWYEMDQPQVPSFAASDWSQLRVSLNGRTVPSRSLCPQRHLFVPSIAYTIPALYLCNSMLLALVGTLNSLSSLRPSSGLLLQRVSGRHLPLASISGRMAAMSTREPRIARRPEQGS